MALVFMSHHKAGTQLLKGLIVEQARVLQLSRCNRNVWLPDCSKPNDPDATVGIWFLSGLLDYQSFKPAWGANFRFVHMIRDPIALVVSGYVAHTRLGTGVVPPDTPPGAREEAIRPMPEGVIVEAWWVVKNTGRNMYAIMNSLPRDKTVHVHFEDFVTSSASFDKTVASLYDFTVGDMISRASMAELVAKASSHDVHRRPASAQTARAAPKGTEERVERTLSTIPRHEIEELQHLRAQLGYA